MRNSPLILLFFLLISCNNTNYHKYSGVELSNYGEPTNPLILISIDGFRWDYFDKVDTPNFDRLIANGSKADGLKTVYPSKTFPNHISIVTGNYPSNHGIISNYFYDPDTTKFGKRPFYIGAGSTAAQDGRWINAEPVWVTVEKQAKRAMIMFWPMSDAEIMGIRPSEYYVYNEESNNKERMDQILSWLDYNGNARPSFLASYFSSVDHNGHDHGPNATQTIEAIAEADQAIGHLIDGLEARNILDEVNIIIVSDHGMTETPSSKYINIAEYLNLDDVVIVGRGPFMEIRPKNDNVDEIYQSLIGIEHTQVFKKGETPKDFHYGDNNRIEPILLLADEHWSLVTPGYSSSFGSHGYDPNYRSMNGIFVAHGPVFKSGFSGPEIRNVHLYEMMCSIMNVIPANNDGSLEISKVFLND